MRICLLTHQDLDGEDFPEDDFRCDPRPFLPEVEWHVATIPDDRNVPQRIASLVEQGFDLFFNLCDGLREDEYAGIEVVRALEKHGVPFTGSASDFFDPTRLQMKRACREAGIATPRYAVVREESAVPDVLAKLEFPLFVKYYNSYGSLDLTRHSRVQSEAGLRRQLRKILSRHGRALVEEYIAGVECTVLVAENPEDPDSPTTYTPIQYRFPEGEDFKHEQLKWGDGSELVGSPVRDPRLAARLRDESARFFVALGGSGFGRCDIRVDAAGTCYMLEMNPYCGIYFEEADYGGADLCLAHDPAGHEGFTRQLVAAAFARHRRQHR